MIPPKIGRSADLCMERGRIPNSNLCHCPSSTCGPGHQPMMELIIDILRVGSKNFLGATSSAQDEVLRMRWHGKHLMKGARVLSWPFHVVEHWGMPPARIWSRT